MTWTWELIEGAWRNTSTTVVFALDEWNGHLYLGTRSSADGAELTRSQDGKTWEHISSRGFGDPSNHDIYGFTGFKGMVYAGTYNPHTGCQLWRSVDGLSWEQVMKGGFGDPAQEDAFNIIKFKDNLYVGTWNPESGAEIWRSANGLEWKRVYKCASKNHDYVRAFAIAGDRLYASIGKLGPYALMESSDGDDWVDVGAGSPPSRMTDGLRLAVVDDALVTGLSTWNTQDGRRGLGVQVWRYVSGEWDLVTNPVLGHYANQGAGGMAVHDGKVTFATWNSEVGAQVWLCDDLDSKEWRQINVDGFGDRRNLGCMFGMKSYRGKLYVGTAVEDPDFQSQLWVGTEE